MAAELLTDASRALDANASPYAGAKWYFYASGTSTPQSVYTTAALSVAHANPVVADAGGKFAPIYFDSALQYRGVLKDSTGATTIYDIDPINTGVMSILSQPDGSDVIGFAQGGSGAVNGSMLTALRRGLPLTPQDYGAEGDGSTDDTAAFNYWIAALNANPTAMGYVPPADYAVGGSLDPFTRSVEVYGCGEDSKIIFSSATAEGFSFQGQGSRLRGLHLRHVNADGGTQHTAGFLAKISHASELNRGSLVEHCFFAGGKRQLHLERATSFKAIGNFFADPKSTALAASVYIENLFHPDAGDNHFIGNAFGCVDAAGSPNRVGIHHVSSGGLHLTNNKFLYYDYHYFMELAAGAGTSNWFAANNSFEWAQIASCAFTSAYTDNGFENVGIGVNQFGSNETDILIAANAGNPDWIYNISIGDIVSRKAEYSIRIFSGDNVSIGAGKISGLSGTNGIEIGAAVTDVKLSGPKVDGFTSPFVIGTSDILIQRTPQYVPVTVTLSGGVYIANVYSGSATVALPKSFPCGMGEVEVEVHGTYGAGGGGFISAWADSVDLGDEEVGIAALGANNGGNVNVIVTFWGY